MSSQARTQRIATAPRGPRRRIAIGNALVDSCSFDEAASYIAALALAGATPAYVVTPNAQHIVLLANEQRLREVYREADLAVPDGFSLLLAARALGSKFPDRVAGVDLFEALCARAARSGMRVFLLGGRTGSADRAASLMTERYPGLCAGTYCPPVGFETSELELARVAQAVTAFAPDLLFVALGAPKQEYWIYDHGRKLGPAVCIGVGGTFELVTGIVPRAPLWIRNIGCEWVYRLCREPRRMWRRYLLGNFQFAAIILKQVLTAAPNTPAETSRAAAAGHRSR